MHDHTAASIDTEKNWFALDSRFRSSTDSSDGCCCTNHNRHRNKFQVSRNGPKTTPIHDSNTGPREKQSDKEQRSQTRKGHQFTKRKSSGQGCKQNQRTLKRLLKNCTKVKADVENRRLLQHPLLCKTLSGCLHPSRSK